MDRKEAMKLARERRIVELVAARTLAPEVRELTFEVRSGSPFPFEAGQYINLHIPVADATLAPNGSIQRSYSMAAAPNGGQLVLAATRVAGGPGSGHLHAAELGERLEADGPWGIFTLARVPEDAPMLFVATGTGLTPIRAMIEAELASGRSRPLRLVYGCRREEDRIYREDLEAWQAAHPRFRVITALSRPDDGRAGQYVQDRVGDALDELARASEGSEVAPHALLCGLRAMIDDVRGLLKDVHGFGRERIHTERYD